MFLSQRSFQMVSFCQHTKDRPGCWAHSVTPPFLGPHPNLLRFHHFRGVFGNLCTLASPPSVPTNSKVLLQCSLNPQGVLGHWNDACWGLWWHLEKGMGGALLRLGDDFSLGLSWPSFPRPCVQAPGPGLWAGATLRLPAGRLSSGCQLASGVRVPWAWHGRSGSCSEKNTVGELPGGKGSKSK